MDRFTETNAAAAAYGICWRVPKAYLHGDSCSEERRGGRSAEERHEIDLF